ncbi:MAG: Lrp/AsnC family transcriptional regulator [Chloroflexota bacterium]
MKLDETDTLILNYLQKDSSISNVKLAGFVNLSPAATLTRVKKLEQEGFIKGYTAVIDTERLGYSLLCMVQVSLETHEVQLVNQFREQIQEMPEVLECYFLTGQSDYLLKVTVKDRQALEYFLVNTLTPASGVARLQTSVILNEVKTSSVLGPA